MANGVMTTNALETFRSVVTAGGFAEFARLDPKSGELVDPEARALFAGLPVVTPATHPDELVEKGLLLKLPRGLGPASQLPRYISGRPLFVRTTVDLEGLPGLRSAGTYLAGGPSGVTHLATLRDRRGDTVDVEIEGSGSLHKRSIQEILSLNQPLSLPAAGASLGGVHFDFADPLWRALVAASLTLLSSDLRELDLDADDAAERQIAAVRKLSGLLTMKYPGRGVGYSGTKAAALAVGGLATCFGQRAVLVGLLQCLARTLGIEVQAAVGMTLRRRALHGFAVVTLRPSFRRVVCDPAWGEPATDLRVAFFDQGWGHDRRLLGFEGPPLDGLTVRDSDWKMAPSMGPRP